MIIFWAVVMDECDGYEAVTLSIWILVGRRPSARRAVQAVELLVQSAFVLRFLCLYVSRFDVG